MYKNPLPKLPKGLQDPALLQQVGDWLMATHQPLRTGGNIGVTMVDWSPAVEAALLKVLKKGQLVQGLEQIKRELDNERKGLLAAAKKQGESLTPRLSRYLVLASDGSDRFYRQVENLLTDHKDRLAGCVLAVESTQLGQKFSKKQQPVKALLIKDRKCLEEFLTDCAA